jgi:hypothetical protein
MTTPTSREQREALARMFEGADDVSDAPDLFPEDLVLRARQFLEQRVVELGAHEATTAAYEVHERSGGEADATLAVKAALARAIEQARSETARAIREGRI